MKQIVCVYCEGNETKIAVFSKSQDTIKLLRIASSSTVGLVKSAAGEKGQLEEFSSGDISLDEFGNVGGEGSVSDVGLVADELSSVNLKNSLFVPIITEPIANYHIYEGDKDLEKSKLIDSIIQEIENTKGIVVDSTSIDCIDFNEKSILSVFVEADIPSVNFINSLASHNRRRYYRIPTIKTADLSLAYFVSKNTKFFPEDNSLIIYIGKEYSKLIFLEGQRLKHLGATLDIGTKNLHTYDVYFSKILLEMENGGIPKLDNIIICGEDRSENLLLSFYGTFPEANVTELKFENVDTSTLEAEDINHISAYSIPISVATEYFDEQDKLYTGINILPRYIKERQKVLQFGWHSYALFPLIFGAAFFFTNNILTNFSEMKKFDREIEELTFRQIQNQAIVDQMTPLTGKINSFDVTQSILDSASVGSEMWGNALDKASSFIERRRNFWITKLETVSKNEIRLTGYSLSRSVLTEFAQYNSTSLLKSIVYEPLREKNTFVYTLNYKIDDIK